MKSDVTIEWLVEELDSNGDIYNVIHCDTYAAATKAAGWSDSETDIGLVRDRGNPVDGLLDRQWAYLRRRQAARTVFGQRRRHDGPKVPARYHLEIQRSKWR